LKTIIYHAQAAFSTTGETTDMITIIGV